MILLMIIRITATNKNFPAVYNFVKSETAILSRHSKAMNQRCSESNGLPKDEETKLKKRKNRSRRSANKYIVGAKAIAPRLFARPSAKTVLPRSYEVHVHHKYHLIFFSTVLNISSLAMI